MTLGALARTRVRSLSAWFTAFVVRSSALVLGCAAATAAWAQTPLSDIVAIDAGTRHACALTSAGQVKCWGDNVYGQAGHPTTGAGSSLSMAVTVPGVEGATAITTLESHTCARVAGGAMKCWGLNWYGVLGAQSDVPTVRCPSMGLD